ncbi:DUF732 domain-containing protein [[Mycobacterium] crassicus]|uniref:DUF732 domain-containing protein n=1 Tax=[Mycobacterium] crassicus TaxID=2872309 RepID=A0ABU5XCI1_9MYCO|nr:DUF732 domain-containing protein [Mycolicibacter sp. MYC098]MEB3020015.1 DUF732 domain-containing protein [Mycolicibacter sp. MYC098]
MPVDILSVKGPGNPIRRRGHRNAWVGTALGVLAGAAALAVMAGPAGADPADPGVVPGNSSDSRFVHSLDQIGIPYAGESEAVNSARNACTQLAEGHSIREAVDVVRDANPALSLLQGAHFVAIARTIYCPGHREAL